MGHGKLSVILSDLHRGQRAATAATSVGMLTSRTTNGVVRKPAWRPKPRGGGGECKRFKIVSVQTDYLTCNPYNAAGTVDTGSTVYVAKPPALRDADGEFTRTVGSSTVTEEIRLPYAANEDIYALESSVPTGVVDGSSNPVTWIDLNVDARHRAPKFVQLQGCEAGVTKYRQVVAGTSYT